MVVGLLYPLLYMIYGSFRAWDPSQKLAETEFVGLNNYIKLINDPSFVESLTATLKFAAAVVSIEMLIGVSLALLLDRNIRGMSVLRTLFIDRILSGSGIDRLAVAWMPPVVGFVVTAVGFLLGLCLPCIRSFSLRIF